MKKLKKSGAILLTAILAGTLALAGCGSDENRNSSADSTASVDTAVSSQVSSAESAPASGGESANSTTDSQASGTSSVNSGTTSSLTSPGAVPEGEKVEDSYFDDAVFIGDSVSYKLELFTTKQRKTAPSYLGKAKFLTAGSLGSGNALWKISKDSVHPSYQGEKMLLEDAVAAMGAKKVYIMLGMNDIAVYGIEGSVQNMETVLGKIKEKSLDVVFYVQSATPMLATAQKTQLNNKNLEEYDKQLAAMCEKNGYHFVDVASVMRDENGALPAKYCSDPNDGGVHFTDEACTVWVQYLYTHTA